MPDTDEALTLQGLARILRDHAGDAASQFAQLREQDARLQTHLRAQDERYHAEQREQDARYQARMDELHREIGAVAGMVRDLSQISIRHMDEAAEHRRQLEEHRQYIRQIFARMEQHDAVIAQTTLDIRRILDAIERRGGNGGSRPEAQQP
jgi:hypothetical protein